MKGMFVLAAGLVALTSCGDAAAPALVVDRVELSSQAVTVGPNSTVQMSAVARTVSGQEVPGRVVTWSGGTAGIATISPNGLVTAIALGATTVTATVDGKSASADVSVVPTQPAHLAAHWKMDSFDNKTLPAAYAFFYDEPVGGEIVAVVEIRLDSATKTISTLGRYQRAYFFSEYHDGVKRFAYQWGDHGVVNLGAGVPVPVNMFSEYIQNVFTSGQLRSDVKLALNEELWIGEAKHSTLWSRR